jgi:hypothetical protein
MSTLTITPGDIWDADNEYYVDLESDILRDENANTRSNLAFNNVFSFSTNSLPVITNVTPIDNATGIISSTFLSITVDRDVYVNIGNIGNIYLHKADGTLVETFDINGIVLSNNTIIVNPTDPFEAGTEYYVLMDPDTVVDVDNFGLPGITDITEFSFTTDSSPLLSSFTPLLNSTNQAKSTTIQLIFDQPVQAGNGNIILYKGDGTIHHSFDISEVNFLAGHPSIIELYYNTLDPSTTYYLNIDNQAVYDADAGFPFAGLSQNNIIRFTTAAAPSISNIVRHEDMLDFTVSDINPVTVNPNNNYIHITNPNGIIESLTYAHLLQRNTPTTITRGQFLYSGDDYVLYFPTGTIVNDAGFGNMETSLNFTAFELTPVIQTTIPITQWGDPFSWNFNIQFNMETPTDTLFGYDFNIEIVASFTMWDYGPDAFDYLVENDTVSFKMHYPDIDVVAGSNPFSVRYRENAGFIGSTISKVKLKPYPIHTGILGTYDYITQRHSNFYIEDHSGRGTVANIQNSPWGGPTNALRIQSQLQPTGWAFDDASEFTIRPLFAGLPLLQPKTFEFVVDIPYLTGHNWTPIIWANIYAPYSLRFLVRDGGDTMGRNEITVISGTGATTAALVGLMPLGVHHISLVLWEFKGLIRVSLWIDGLLESVQEWPSGWTMDWWCLTNYHSTGSQANPEGDIFFDEVRYSNTAIFPRPELGQVIMPFAHSSTDEFLLSVEGEGGSPYFHDNID